MQSAAVLPIKKIADDKFKFCRRLNFILPMANKKFAVYPVRNLPSASETLAESAKFMSDKWQNKILPSANVK